MESIRSLIPGKKEEPTFWEEMNQECSLSYKNRMIGFGVCLALGLFFSFMALFFLPGILLNPASFAVPYTLGNVLALASTLFLIGPMRQLKNMFKPTRLIAAIIYLLFMALTLWAAFTGKPSILVLLFVIIQFGAIVWYVLSYIPFARSCMKSMFSSVTSV